MCSLSKNYSYFPFQEAVKDAQKLLNKQKEILKATNKDISQKINEKKTLQKEANNAQLKSQELDHNIQKCTKQSHDAVKTVSFPGLNTSDC